MRLFDRGVLLLTLALSANCSESGPRDESTGGRAGTGGSTTGGSPTGGSTSTGGSTTGGSEAGSTASTTGGNANTSGGNASTSGGNASTSGGTRGETEGGSPGDSGAAGAAETGGSGGEAAAGGALGTKTRCDGFTIPADHPNAAQDYTVAAGVVTDAVTGLMWEVTPTAADAGPFQETRCSTRDTGRFNGWRRPTLLELASIVDYGVRDPAFDVAVFPDNRVGYFATSTPVYQNGKTVGGGDGYGWTVNATNGLWMNGLPPSFLFRCVRDATPRRCYPATERFQATPSSAVAEVYDASSGLTWQRHAAPEAKSWNDAKSYCEGLGNGYRLPGVKELLSIFDFETPSRPAIDASAFPGTSPDVFFWSATRPAGEASKALATKFMSSSYFGAEAFDENTEQYARCVR